MRQWESAKTMIEEVLLTVGTIHAAATDSSKRFAFAGTGTFLMEREKIIK